MFMGVLLFGLEVPDAGCVGCLDRADTRAQAGHLAPARSQQRGEPSGLTGRARVSGLAGIRRTPGSEVPVAVRVDGGNRRGADRSYLK